MPVHFNSIMKKEREDIVLSSILKNILDEPDDVFVPSSKDRFLMINNLVDTNTNEVIGKITNTFITRDNSHELVDVDITLNSSKRIKLNFEEKYDLRSDGNEYYLVSSVDDIYFDVETVGRFRIEKDIEGTENNVSLSAFPFKMSLYDSIEEANKDLGFNPVNVPGIENPVVGFSETFMGSGFANNGESYSIILGKIKSFKNVEAYFGNEKVPFTIVDVETGIGILPTAVNTEIFDLNNIKKGRIVVMFADVKAEF